MTQFLECLLEVFLVKIQVTDLCQPKSPIPPPPPQQGVGDPVAQLLVEQGAMSHLLIQMAQEMNRRASEQGAGDPSHSSGQGSAPGSRKEMKMDEKWIPSMPIARSDHEEQETFSFASAEFHRVQQD